MKVTLSNGLTILIKWYHNNPLSKKLRSSDLKFGTICKIFKEESGKAINELELLNNGKSFLHDKDLNMFNKKKGRLISLKRALYTYSPKNGNYKGFMFSKEDRKLIWDAYNNL